MNKKEKEIEFKSTLLDAIIQEEENPKIGIEKEKSVIKKVMKVFRKFPIIGAVVALLGLHPKVLILRLAIRSIIYVLNDLLGKDWIKIVKAKKEVEKVG